MTQALITVEQLVNVQRKHKWGVTWSEESIKTALKQANQKRPKEIVAFVEALTRMFGRIGMHGVCRLCFKGVLPGTHRDPGYGCCGTCPLLLEDRCANKPVGCARYMCGFTSTLFPRTWNFLGKLSQKVFGKEGWHTPTRKTADGYAYGYYGGCYGGSVTEESKIALTEEQKRRLRWAIRKLDGWQEREAA